MNPFVTQKNRYFDNYAGQMATSMPVGANQGLNTPHYNNGNTIGMQGQKLPTIKQPRSEIERLQKERSELV